MDGAVMKKYHLIFDVSDKSDNDDSDLSEPGQEMSSANGSTSIAVPTRTRITKSRTPRPFALYRKATQYDIVAHNRILSMNSDVYKVISKVWRREKEKEKFQWKVLRANKMQFKHIQDHPYYYQSKKQKPGTKKREQLPMALPSSSSPSPPQTIRSQSPMIQTIFPIHSQSSMAQLHSMFQLMSIDEKEFVGSK